MRVDERLGFEWDEVKNLINQEKHGISFETARQAFVDPKRVIARDMDHEKGEKRFLCFGLVNNAITTVRFSFRRKRIRIFGAGYWRKGRKIYEQKNKIYR